MAPSRHCGYEVQLVCVSAAYDLVYGHSVKDERQPPYSPFRCQTDTWQQRLVLNSTAILHLIQQYYYICSALTDSYH